MKANILYNQLTGQRILSTYELKAVLILIAFIISYFNLNRLEIGVDKC